MKLTEPAKEINVINEVDVCVIGGSCTGVFAAVRAAQQGMRVAIIEKQNAFGGAASSGLVHIWHSLFDTENKIQIIGGLTLEIINRLKEKNAVQIDEPSQSSAYKMNTEELKIELDFLISGYNIIPYLHTVFSSAIVEDNKIKAVIIENKNGRSAIAAKFFIDATGDGDLCRCLNMEAYTLPNMQPPTTCAKLYGTNIQGLQELIRQHHEEFGLKKDWGWQNIVPNIENVRMHAETHVFSVNCANADELTYSEIEGRRQVRAYMDLWRKYAEGGDKITLLSLPSYIGIRDTYHIKSLHKVKSDELLYGVRYKDAIANGSYRVDRHHSEGSGITFKYLDGAMHVIPESGAKPIVSRWREEIKTNPTFYQIPYRTLVPDTKIENILYAGRMIDAEEEAYSALRVMVNANQTGEASGVAAAVAVENSCSQKNVDTDILRKKLTELGAVIF